MASNEIRGSALWTGVHIAVILACALQVLYPAAQRFEPFMLAFGLVLLPLYFFLLIRSLRAEKTGHLSVGGLYAQAKSGKGLPKLGSLQMAATVALILTSIYSTSGQG